MGIKYCSLSSGSSGNCQYIETDRMKVLVDAGFSGKRVEQLLESIDVAPEEIDCLFVTHEHTDHVKGIGVLSRRYNIPIFANEKTWISMDKKIGKIKNENIKIIKAEQDFQLNDLGVLPFNIYHDAADPLGYCFYYKNVKISIMTDTGWVDNKIKNHIKDSSLYLIESNHDLRMLEEGSYPWPLKQRIMSTRGHLSNADTGRILAEVLKGNKETVLLGHLSSENNMPSLAYNTVKEQVEEYGLDVKKDITLDLTHRDKVTKVYVL